MLQWLFTSMLVGPAIAGGPVAVMKWMIVQLSLAIVALAVWGAAPYALFIAWGPWATLPWLVPTTAVVFMLALAKQPEGGG
jgi:hypothetical protein